MQYLPLIVILAALYFLVLRPRSKAQQRGRKVGLNAGDDVVSNSGIFGVVTKAYDQRVFVEVAPSVELIFDRRSLTRVDAVIIDSMEEAEARFDGVLPEVDDDHDQHSVPGEETALPEAEPLPGLELPPTAAADPLAPTEHVPGSLGITEPFPGAERDDVPPSDTEKDRGDGTL